MPAEKIDRTTVVARLGYAHRYPDGVEQYAKLEYRSEDPLWLRAQLKAPARVRTVRAGWLSRVLRSRLPARIPAADADQVVENAAL